MHEERKETKIGHGSTFWESFVQQKDHDTHTMFKCMGVCADF